MLGYFLCQVLISCGIIVYQTLIDDSYYAPADLKEEAGVPGSSDVVIPRNREKPVCRAARAQDTLSSAELSLFFVFSFSFFFYFLQLLFCLCIFLHRIVSFPGK